MERQPNGSRVVPLFSYANIGINLNINTFVDKNIYKNINLSIYY